MRCVNGFESDLVVSNTINFADLKTDFFTPAGKSDFISELEKKHVCVVEVRTNG